MRIAISAEEKHKESPVNPRFGRAGCFMVYDTDEQSWESIDNIQNLQSSQGAGIQSAALVVNSACKVLITGHCGPKAFVTLLKGDVEVYTTSGSTVQEAVSAFERGELVRLNSADVDGHW